MGTIIGNTVWTGTAFSCNDGSNEIALLHSRYASSNGAVGVCNNGVIVARSLRVEDGYYTSQLNVSVTADIAGKTVVCLHDNVSSQIVQFSNTITTGIYYS